MSGVCTNCSLSRFFYIHLQSPHSLGESSMPAVIVKSVEDLYTSFWLPRGLSGAAQALCMTVLSGFFCSEMFNPLKKPGV
uniref:Uncharacterized protein n=1 Tax=Malurus cyaneus samueli TaxID=2593467 RepID=A0A8C5U3X0_9PASS